MIFWVIFWYGKFVWKKKKNYIKIRFVFVQEIIDIIYAWVVTSSSSSASIIIVGDILQILKMFHQIFCFYLQKMSFDVILLRCIDENVERWLKGWFGNFFNSLLKKEKRKNYFFTVLISVSGFPNKIANGTNIANNITTTMKIIKYVFGCL